MAITPKAGLGAGSPTGAEAARRGKAREVSVNFIVDFGGG